jgi:3'-phosphoadenosine 5'-phosphosulfate (PAPS) 3'-phosphatase
MPSQRHVTIDAGQAEDWRVELKADSSPLTVADREGNRIICEALALIDPHIPIISEELMSSPWEVRKVRPPSASTQSVPTGRRGSHTAAWCPTNAPS